MNLFFLIIKVAHSFIEDVADNTYDLIICPGGPGAVICNFIKE